MAIKVKQSGAYADISSFKVKAGGTYATVQNVYAKVNGAYQVVSADFVSPVLYANITTGVAPFGLVFDGAQTICTDPTVRIYHDLTYAIDFGDGSSGTYTSGEFAGLTKNRDAGAPVFVHVYETPGSYTAKLWAYDGTTLYGPSQLPITVTDPNVVYAGAATIAVSDNGDFSWAPAGHTPITQSNIFTALSNAAVTSNKRVLLRPSGSYTCSGSSLKSNYKNFIFAGATKANPPTITATANDLYFLVAHTGGANPANNANNWRVHDIIFDGGGFTGCRGFTSTILPAASGDANIDNYVDGDITAHRITGNGLFATVWINGLNCVTSRVVSTNTVGSSGAMPIYQAGAVRSGVIDCDLDNAHGGEHVMRSQGVDFNAIVSNRFARPASAKAYLTVRGWGVSSNLSPVDSVKHSVRGNTFDGTTQTVGTSIYTDVAPQNTGRNEPIKDVVWESNFYPGCQGDKGLNICARDVTVRNNVWSYVQRTGSVSEIVVQISNPNGTMTTLTDNVHLLNNTAYSSATDGFSFATIQSAVVNPWVCNNVSYAPSATKTGENNGTAPTFFAPTSTFAGSLIQSGNSTDANVKSLNPLFVGTTTMLDFKLQTGSPYKGFGADAYKTRTDGRWYLKGSAPIDTGALNSVDKQVSIWTLVP